MGLRAVSLFSGIGGLDLALEPFGVETLAYCESDAYCQRVLVERIREGHLEDAPIWDDVRTFPTADWRRRVDLVHGGFPCQDLSVAGTGAGLAGARSGLFFELLRVACGVGARWLYMENVPAIRVRGLHAVLGSLADLGWDAEWTTLSAEELGAPHERFRWFCLAHRPGARRTRRAGRRLQREEPRALGGALSDADDGLREPSNDEVRAGRHAANGGGGATVPDAHRRRRRAGREGARSSQRPDADGRGDDEREEVPDAGRARLAGHGSAVGARQEGSESWARGVFPPAEDDDDGWRRVFEHRPDLAPTLAPVRGVVDGLSDRLDRAMAHRRARIRCLGNAVVPAQAALAFAELWERYET